MSELAQIEFEAAVMGAGVSFRIVCPYCGGGSTKERCMSVTTGTSPYDTRILFKCHRANCGRCGSISDTGVSFSKSDVPPVRKEDRPLELYPLNDDMIRHIYREWGIDAHAIEEGGFMYDAISGRLAMPLLTPEGMIQGYVLRSMDGEYPKTINALSYSKVTNPYPASYYGDVDAPSVYLVEDQLSALRLAKYGRSIALCGTHLHHEVYEYIARSDYRRVWIALDRDATGVALRMQRRLAPWCEGAVLVQVLERDIKNMVEEEVEELEMIEGTSD